MFIQFCHFLQLTGGAPRPSGVGATGPPQKAAPCSLGDGQWRGVPRQPPSMELERAAGVYLGGELLFKIRLCF